MDLKLPSELEGMYENFLRELDSINLREEDALSQAKLGMDASIRALGHLRSWLDDNPLLNEFDEINFFKYVKPKFLCQLLFYQEVYRIERRKPNGIPSAIDIYYKIKIRKVQEHYQDARDLYDYLFDRDSHFDREYFLRSRLPSKRSAESLRPDADPHFTTLLDHEVAALLADELLIKFLLPHLPASQVPQETGTTRTPVQGFVWTGTLSGLYEQIYSWVAAGVVNNGNVTISQLAAFFETHFKVNLKHIYRGQQENRIKQNRGAFLRMLLEKYLASMDYADEHPRGRQ